MEYFADGCSVPKDHPDVDEIIVYLQLDIDYRSALPNITDTNGRSPTSSENLPASGSGDKDEAIPGYGSLPGFHFADNNPPATKVSWHNLAIDYAGYAPTNSHPVSGYNPQSIAFPPQATNVPIAEHYGHPLHVFHGGLPSARFNPFADDEPVVHQSTSEGHSYAESVNTGRPVFTNPFDNDRVILSEMTDGMFRTIPNEYVHSSPKQLYTAIPIEHAYTQAGAVVHQSNTDDSSSRSSSRTFVDDSQSVAPILYWVDRFNKLRKI
ncbi:hypothetical protein IW261DRAFT_1511498 [Armillaria novae-zelandiae]|uniref:Uncharacterized protein n=1 Tax=Armillaria novae-zelandiae TaxID=153914 RepID=A0AA39NTK0_9AGAR|nr:hypothetical protein IW261DRAFT_1511498 [Armillaria novae-zelandiae]